MKLMSQAGHKIVKFLSRRLSADSVKISPVSISSIIIIGVGLNKNYRAGQFNEIFRPTAYYIYWHYFLPACWLVAQKIIDLLLRTTPVQGLQPQSFLLDMAIGMRHQTCSMKKVGFVRKHWSAKLAR